MYSNCYYDNNSIYNYDPLGSTERAVLKNFEEIVERSLPPEKVTKYYKESPGAAKEVILNYVTFFEERKLVSKLNLYMPA